MRANIQGGIRLIFFAIAVALAGYLLLVGVGDYLFFQNAPEVQEAKLIQKLKNIEHYNALFRWGAVVVPALIGILALVHYGSKAQSRIRQASVYMAEIGKSKIPLYWKHIKRGDLGPILVGLTNAEILKQHNAGVEKALELNKEIAETQRIQMQTLRQGYQRQLDSSNLMALSQGTLSVPTFHDLLLAEDIAYRKPLIVGYEQGQPQYRKLEVFKSMAIAGYQGSGKTRSTGYLIACAALACGARVFVCDPHANHDESLYALIQPLEETPLVTVINPFDLPALVRQLNNTLDRRLAGEERSDPPILFVIDELARVAKMDVFDTLLTFIERCTEETRKANITFFGGSPKWTARYFGGRADIRGCMNSMLIHKTKPSQADLLLEDSQDKKLVRELHKPGDAILVTDYGDPHVVSMPLAERDDMQLVADLISKHYTQPLQIRTPQGGAETGTEAGDPDTLTPKLLRAHLTPEGSWGQREISRRTGVNQSKISNFKNGNASALNDNEKQTIFDLVMEKDPKKSAAEDEAHHDNHVLAFAGNQVMS